MLVLSRKQKQEIYLYTSDGLIRVVVTELRGKGERKVLLGFAADLRVKILRQEIAPAFVGIESMPVPTSACNGHSFNGEVHIEQPGWLARLWDRIRRLWARA